MVGFSLHLNFTRVFLVLGGSLEIYGAIPEPVLGRISVAVNIIKILLKFTFHVTLHEYIQYSQNATEFMKDVNFTGLMQICHQVVSSLQPEGC